MKETQNENREKITNNALNIVIIPGRRHIQIFAFFQLQQLKIGFSSVQGTLSEIQMQGKAWGGCDGPRARARAAGALISIPGYVFFGHLAPRNTTRPRRFKVHAIREGRFAKVPPSFCRFLVGFGRSERKYEFSAPGSTINLAFLNFFQNLCATPLADPQQNSQRHIKYVFWCIQLLI